MNIRLEGHVAVVTGAGRGIGRSIAEALAASGAQVIGCGRTNPDPGMPGEIVWVTADVSCPGDVAKLRRMAEAQLGVVTILVNNAGQQRELTVVESRDDDWDAVVGTNCKGVFNCCREFIPAMKQSGSGRIINLGSISGQVSDRRMALYNASKGFVHALTRSIAVDHGPQIRCNAVLPGWILTDMAEAAFDMARDAEAATADARARHPSSRLGRPTDIAGFVVWLASDQAEFMTGQCVVMDGGLTAASPLRPDLF